MRRKLRHYNEENHAHELTFSCFHQNEHLKEKDLCVIFMEELEYASVKFEFYLWAYVLMPTHVHLLLLPKKAQYNISRMLQEIKGRTSTRYRQWILQSDPEHFDHFCVMSKGRKTFRLWQPGGGFDRNLWNSKAVHYSIKYIENNPVKARFVENPEAWPWSSARARVYHEGLMPDKAHLPLLLK